MRLVLSQGHGRNPAPDALCTVHGVPSPLQLGAQLRTSPLLPTQCARRLASLPGAAQALKGGVTMNSSTLSFWTQRWFIFKLLVPWAGYVLGQPALFCTCLFHETHTPWRRGCLALPCAQAPRGRNQELRRYSESPIKSCKVFVGVGVGSGHSCSKS